MPILIVKDDRTKMVFTRVVPSDSCAVGALKTIMEQLQYKRIVMKSDNEPPIMLLKDLVRVETDVEIVTEESPVGDHQANGAAENAVKNVQGRFRVLKDALEARLGARIGEEKPAIPWLIMHAGSVISRRRVDKGVSRPTASGKTSRSTDQWWSLGRMCCTSRRFLWARTSTRCDVPRSLAWSPFGER